MRSAEFVTARELQQEFLASPYYSDDLSYIKRLQAIVKFLRAKNINPEASKGIVRRLNYLTSVEVSEEDLAKVFAAE